MGLTESLGLSKMADSRRKKYTLEYPVKKVATDAESADTETHPSIITFQRHKISDSVMWVWCPVGPTEMVTLESAQTRWNALVDAGWTLCD